MNPDFVSQTLNHIATVKNYLFGMCFSISERAMRHDASKLQDPEAKVFEEFTPKLKDSTYGSEEYQGFLKDMKPALDHHYAKNRHHPEYHKDGIDDMNLVDIMEMFADWLAASQRHADGDIMKSIEINKDRFGMSDQLVSIFKNSVELFDD